VADILGKVRLARAQSGPALQVERTEHKSNDMVTTLHKSAPHLEFKIPGIRERLKPVISRIIKQFPKLPSLRLLCYFDDEYPEELRHQLAQWGVHTPLTGIHTPIIGSGNWPHYVRRHFFDYSSGDFAFDNLIYIPGTKYAEEDISFVIIFAHELQHFVQWGFARKVSQVNTLLLWNLAQFDPKTELKPWGLPNNREAMIVANRVAEALYGREPVEGFVDAQIVDGKKNNNLSKMQLWQWVRTLTPSSRYDVLEETDRLVQKYKQQLMSLESEIDFSKAKWWI
jgi:hypothetical protein